MNTQFLLTSLRNCCCLLKYTEVVLRCTGQSSPLRLRSTLAPPNEQLNDDDDDDKVGLSAESTAPNDTRATPLRLPVDEGFTSAAEEGARAQQDKDKAEDDVGPPWAGVAQSKRGGKTAGIEKQWKPGKDKGRKGSFQKGGRRRGHKNKLVPYGSSTSSSDDDLVQSDSGYVRTNSTFFRKELPHVTAGDKSNEAWRDKGFPSSGLAASRVTCNEMKCVKGGQCLEDSSLLGDPARCQCQLGTKGEFCEKGKTQDKLPIRLSITDRIDMYNPKLRLYAATVSWGKWYARCKCLSVFLSNRFSVHYFLVSRKQ